MIKKSKKSKRFTIKNKNTLTSNSKPKRVLRESTKVKNATKCEYNDISFKSKLEMFMYKELEKQELFINYIYEKIPFVLQNSFRNLISFYERNNKSKLYGLSSQTVRSMTYTPDFVVYYETKKENKCWIIETKGLRTDSFTLKFKLFKNIIKEGYELEIDNVKYKLQSVHVPTNQAECKKALEMIMYVRNRDLREEGKE